MKRLRHPGTARPLTLQPKPHLPHHAHHPQPQTQAATCPYPLPKPRLPQPKPSHLPAPQHWPHSQQRPAPQALTALPQQRPQLQARIITALLPQQQSARFHPQQLMRGRQLKPRFSEKTGFEHGSLKWMMWRSIVRLKKPNSIACFQNTSFGDGRRSLEPVVMMISPHLGLMTKKKSLCHGSCG